MTLYAAVKDLPLTIDSYATEYREKQTTSGFLRATSLISLRGGGHEGQGEDVTYETADHEHLRDAGPVLDLAGTYTFDTFSEALGGLDLFPKPAARDSQRMYRRWAFEAAGLDLALRQAGTTLHAALGRECQPVRFVVSLRIGSPPDLAVLQRRLDLYPWLQFKLDPTSDWTAEVIASLAATGAVESVDFKAHYGADISVSQAPDPALYQRVIDGLDPAVWIEDPALTPECDAILKPHRDRITWDAPLHDLKFLTELPFAPKMVNIKPSRFGTVSELFATYDYCEANGIKMYGGGQFELGVGRGQIQYLASLFHGDAPNDVAPGSYNEPEITAGNQVSPLAPAASAIGFRWG